MADALRTRASLLARLGDPQDRGAWQQFVDLYGSLVYSFARRRGLQDADAADLTQEVFLAVSQATQGRWQYDPQQGSFRGWLHGLTRNKIAKFLRRRHVQPVGSGDSDAQQRLAEEPSPALDLDGAWEQEFQQQLFRLAAAQIQDSFAPTTWRAFWATAVEGRSAAAVALELNLSVGAVYVARSRAWRDWPNELANCKKNDSPAEVLIMPAVSSCPRRSHLRQLVTGAPAPRDRAELIAHLDACPACQRLLEQLTDASAALLDAAASQSDTYAEEAPLRRVLDDLKRDPTAILAREDQLAGLSLRRAGALENLGPLGAYEVTKTLGQGGMGLVFQAFDPSLKRSVAIKVLAPALAGDKVARLRFAREAQAAAAVRHEHVVTIHAVSEVDGLPYFVMEHLAGGSLQDYLDRHGPPDWPAIARLGAEVASGLAAAHARGLIHRDIKPSNVLLQEGAPGELGAAKLGDFGLARVADDCRLTQTGVLAGTPLYMAPEQAQGEPLDHRADLFSFGSVLYALCTGRDPFPGTSPLAVLRQVCESTPTPVRDVNSAIPPWLAAVVERLHAKRPADRFASANEVAELLRYNLEHPDQPRPVPAPPRQRRRHAFRVVALTALAGLLLAFALLRPTSPHGPPPTGAAPDNGQHEPLPPRATLQGHTGPIWSVAFSPDGQLVATGSDDATLRIWDATTGKEKAVLSKDSTVFAVAFAHSGKFLLSGSGAGNVHFWEVARRKERPALLHREGSIRRLAISPDDKTVALSSNTQSVELWGLDTGRLRQVLGGHHGTILAIAFAPDGKALATGDARGHIRIWEPTTGKERAGFQGDPLGLRALAFSPDSQTLASAGTGDRNVKLWRVATHKKLTNLGGHENHPLSLAFSADGALLATGSREGAVIIWDVQSARAVEVLSAHQGAVWSLAFSPDGRTLATVGEDRVGKLWNLPGRSGGSR